MDNNNTKQRRNASNKTTIAALQKSNTLMKTMNKDLAMNLQSLKEDLTKSKAQNSTLKAELYDMIMERNSLLEKNMKLIELLRSLQSEALSMGKRIEETVNHRILESDRLVTKQSAVICPMVSGHVIHNPKVELRRLNFNDYPNAANIRGNGTISLPSIVEEQFIEDVVPRRLGHRLRLSQNITSITNRGINEDSFYSENNWPVDITSENENSNGVLYSEVNNPEQVEPEISSSALVENNVTPSVSDEDIQQPENNNDIVDADSKPSGSRNSVEESRNSTETGRNSTPLLTINLMSSQNDAPSSNIPVNPSVYVNVFPRKRKYPSKYTSHNGYSVSGIPDENQDSDQCSRIHYREPVIVLERHPVLADRTLNSPIVKTEADDSGEENLNTPCDVTENRTTGISRQRNLVVKSEDGEVAEVIDVSKPKRRSSRNKKIINYRELDGLNTRCWKVEKL